MSTTTGRKTVALTFDDGPNPPYTDQILDILKKEGIKATFFVCGKNAKKHPALVKRIAKEGHLVGNHSYYHQYLPSLFGLTNKEIVETQKLIETLTGQKQKLFRAPWGKIPPWLKSKLESENIKIIEWDIMVDYKGLLGTTVGSPDEIINRVASAKDGNIIVLHEKTHGTDALYKLIKSLKEKGFGFSGIRV